MEGIPFPFVTQSGTVFEEKTFQKITDILFEKPIFSSYLCTQIPELFLKRRVS